MKSRKSHILLAFMILTCMCACNIIVMRSEGTVFKQPTAEAGAWVVPDGFSDPDSKWGNEANAYDNNTVTCAESFIVMAHNWGSWLNLTLSASVRSSKLRFYVSSACNLIDIHAVIDGTETQVYQGTFFNNQWVEKSFSEGLVSQISFRFHNEDIIPFTSARIKEGQVWQVQETPVQRKLTVVSGYGSPVPYIGDHNYNDGDSVTCSVTNPVTEEGITWICTGWSGTGSVPASGSGTSVTFTITQDSNITWNWQANCFRIPEVPFGAITVLIVCLFGLVWKRLRQHVH